jgi:hypothetical protein
VWVPILNLRSHGSAPVASAPLSAPPRAVKRLTVAQLVECTGEEDLEQVTEIEMLFGSVHELDNLGALVNLRSLAGKWLQPGWSCSV